MAQKKDGRGGPRKGAGRPRKPKAARPLPNSIRRLIGKMTVEQMKEMAQENAALAIGTLLDVATNGDKDAARVSAANALLDRGFGRPSAPAPARQAPAPEDQPPKGDDTGGWDTLLQ